MIDILSIQGKTQAEVIDLILDQGKQPMGILVAKMTDEDSDRDDIATEYGSLAYYGQQLADVSDSFVYQHIAPDDDTPVQFTVSTSRITELAETLLDICAAVSADPEEDFPDIDDLVPSMLRDLFLEDVMAKKLKPACKYFYDISVEYSKRKRKVRK